MRKKKNKKKPYTDYDDGRVIANMDIEGMPKQALNKARKMAKNRVEVTKKERRKIILAAYLAYIPALMLILAVFTLLFLFLKKVWLGA